MHIFRGNPLHQATKRHLNNRWTVKNDTKKRKKEIGLVFTACSVLGGLLAWSGMIVCACQQSSKNRTSCKNSTKTGFVFLFHFSSFLTVYPLSKCRFVAWSRGFPRKCADCVSVLKQTSVRLNLFVFGSRFRTLAVILFQMFVNVKLIFWKEITLLKRRYIHRCC